MPAGVCGYLEIADRFWPYQRATPPEATCQAWTYTAKVKQLLLARACVQSSFAAADYRLAMDGADATALHAQPGAADSATRASVTVTLEPAGGIAQPTSTAIIVAAL